MLSFEEIKMAGKGLGLALKLITSQSNLTQLIIWKPVLERIIFAGLMFDDHNVRKTTSVISARYEIKWNIVFIQ